MVRKATHLWVKISPLSQHFLFWVTICLLSDLDELIRPTSSHVFTSAPQQQHRHDSSVNVVKMSWILQSNSQQVQALEMMPEQRHDPENAPKHRTAQPQAAEPPRNPDPIGSFGARITPLRTQIILVPPPTPDTPQGPAIWTSPQDWTSTSGLHRLLGRLQLRPSLLFPGGVIQKQGLQMNNSSSLVREKCGLPWTDLNTRNEKLEMRKLQIAFFHLQNWILSLGQITFLSCESPKQSENQKSSGKKNSLKVVSITNNRESANHSMPSC